jgi:hypothetical protein
MNIFKKLFKKPKKTKIIEQHETNVSVAVQQQPQQPSLSSDGPRFNPINCDEDGGKGGDEVENGASSNKKEESLVRPEEEAQGDLTFSKIFNNFKRNLLSKSFNCEVYLFFT